MPENLGDGWSNMLIYTITKRAKENLLWRWIAGVREKSSIVQIKGKT